MSSRICTALILALAMVSGAAYGNGRFPATTNVHLAGSDSDLILIPVTFGLLVSRDGGQTLHWVCEDAIGYGGIFDPDYELAPDGTIWANNFEGLVRSTDGGCTWETVGELGQQFVGDLDIDSTGRVWAGASSVQENGIYSIAPGESTLVRSNLDVDRGWWSSLSLAPSDDLRLYASGFIVASDPGTDAVSTPTPTLYRSVDGGANWEPLPVDSIEIGDNPLVFVAGVHPSDPDIVFVRSEAARPGGGDYLYRSDDGGLTWTRVLEMEDKIAAFLIRADASLYIAGTKEAGVRVSTDGVTWSAPSTQPELVCVDESSDGTLWGCGANFDPDNFAIARSSDGMTWDGVFTFVEIDGPLDCPEGTVQRDTCATEIWPGLADQLGIDRPLEPDAGPGGGDDKKGCGCSSTGTSPAIALFWLAILVVIAAGFRPRRR